jgi:hypothetical protein
MTSQNRCAFVSPMTLKDKLHMSTVWTLDLHKLYSFLVHHLDAINMRQQYFYAALYARILNECIFYA